MIKFALAALAAFKFSSGALFGAVLALILLSDRPWAPAKASTPLAPAASKSFCPCVPCDCCCCGDAKLKPQAR